MKHINKRTDKVSRKALKKSVKASERQLGKKDLLERLGDDDYDPRHDWRDCSCRQCNDYILDYLPFLEQNTIGGRFIKTLIQLDMIPKWQDYTEDYNTSELFYHLRTTKEGVIASVYVPKSK